MLTTAEKKALATIHGPNLYVTIVSALAMLAAGFGLKSSAATLVSFAVMVASLIWSNGKLSTTVHAVVHSGNFWTVVGTAIGYVLTRVFGIHLPSGLVPAVGAMVATFVVGNTIRKPATPSVPVGTANAGQTTPSGS